MAVKFIVQIDENSRWKAVYKGSDPHAVQRIYHELRAELDEGRVRVLKAVGVKEDGTTRWASVRVPETELTQRRGLYSLLADSLHSFWVRRGYEVSRREVAYIYLPAFLFFFASALFVFGLVLIEKPKSQMAARVAAPDQHARSVMPITRPVQSEKPATQSSVSLKMGERKAKVTSPEVQGGPPADLAFLQGKWSSDCLAALASKEDISLYVWDVEHQTFRLTLHTFVGGEYITTVKSDVVRFELSGDMLTETNGAVVQIYKVSNRDSSEYFNRDSKNPTAAPKLDLLEMRVNGHTIEGGNDFYRCLPAK